MGFEKSVVKSKRLYQLAESKAKDCDRHLSPSCGLGKVYLDAKGVWPR